MKRQLDLIFYKVQSASVICNMTLEIAHISLLLSPSLTNAEINEGKGHEKISSYRMKI